MSQQPVAGRRIIDRSATGLRALVRRRGFARVARYALETALVYAVYGFFRVLPLDAASAVGGAAMRAIGPRLRRTKDIVVPQLAMAFPAMDEAARGRVMTAMWDNVGRVFAEYAHLDDILSRVSVTGREHLDQTQACGRPVIFVAGHIGNWEIAPIVVQSAGIDLNVVYRAPNNPWVEGLLRRARSAGSGGRQIAKGAAGARQIVKVLRGNGAVGMLVDQKLSGAPLVPFFGHPAQTLTSAFVFARKFNARVHYVRIERLSGAHFRATISPEVTVGDDETAFLAAMNAELESWIRVHPAQWLWTHRRWERTRADRT